MGGLLWSGGQAGRHCRKVMPRVAPDVAQGSITQPWDKGIWDGAPQALQEICLQRPKEKDRQHAVSVSSAP